MNGHSWLVSLSSLGVAMWLIGAATGQPPPPAPQPPPQPAAQTAGVEVQARGPVHAAFAEPVDTKPTPSPVVAKQPPDPIDEVPPEQKPEGNNVQWIPGYWAWDQERSEYLWVSGFWRQPPPGRQWLPGHWQQVAGGWQWTPGFWGLNEQKQISYAPPPPASPETGPSVPQPGPDSSYVPGSWVYQETRYRWRPGFWLQQRPGWVWTPASYLWTPRGCVFVEGYWDFPLRQRGLLFAPVRIDPRVLVRGWQYVPRYVVRDESLEGALFVRAAVRHYYFGDYFDARYRQQGFVAWGDYRLIRDIPDPLFSYYRSGPTGQQWEREVRELYGARAKGAVPPPPQTLVQQEELVRRLTREGSRAVDRLVVLAPLATFDQKEIKLEKVLHDQHEQAKKAEEWYRRVEKERREFEKHEAHKQHEQAKKQEEWVRKMAEERRKLEKEGVRVPGPVAIESWGVMELPQGYPHGKAQGHFKAPPPPPYPGVGEHHDKHEKKDK